VEGLTSSQDSRRATGRGGGAGGRNPRVVILGAGETARVEVVDLPDGSGVGDRFPFLGRTWRITGVRESSRVLFAESLEA